jgi:hypothetical protein
MHRTGRQAPWFEPTAVPERRQHMELNEMIAAVRKHALKHYEEGGWDILVETYDDEEIIEVIKDCKNLDEAIKAVGEAVGVVADVRADVWGSGGLCTTCAEVEPENCVHRKSYRADEVVHWKYNDKLEVGQVLNDCSSDQDPITVMHGAHEADMGMVEIKRKWLVDPPSVPF